MFLDLTAAPLQTLGDPSFQACELFEPQDPDMRATCYKNGFLLKPFSS